MNPYSRLYFIKRNHLVWRSDIMARAIKNALTPYSVLDIGCATGDLVKGFLDLGLDAYGLDLHVPMDMLLFPVDKFIRWNIKRELIWEDRKFDLVTCIETVSVLPETDAEVICENLMRLGDVLLLSADPKLRAPYDNILEREGYIRDLGAERKVREPIEEIKHRLAVKALYNGVSVWRKLEED